MFQAAAVARAWAYGRGYLETVRVPAPVFCVGNLTVGGSGKTPVVAWLADFLVKKGHRPVVLTRGYGRSSKDITLVANRDGQDFPDREVIGDEPGLLARRLPGVPLAVGADRARAAEQAIAAFGPDCFVMDDGFQHHRLYRDRNLLCLDARLAHEVWVRGEAAPFLPAGPWRESPGNAARADALLLTRAERLTEEERTGLRAALAPLRKPLGFAHYRLSFWDPHAGKPVAAAELAGKPVLALSGLADPASFENSLERLGARVAVQRHGDHHVFTPADLARARERAEREGRVIVTTEKDAQRLPRDFPARVARLDLEWEDRLWTSVIDSAFASNS